MLREVDIQWVGTENEPTVWLKIYIYRKGDVFLRQVYQWLENNFWKHLFLVYLSM